MIDTLEDKSEGHISLREYMNFVKKYRKFFDVKFDKLLPNIIHSVLKYDNADESDE